MPSASVSDGIQSSVMMKHSEAIFCPVETTGDGAVNFQSRVLMFLFKARQKARDEFTSAIDDKGMTKEEAEEKYERKGIVGLNYPKHKVVGTGANRVLQM